MEGPSVIVGGDVMMSSYVGNYLNYMEDYTIPFIKLKSYLYGIDFKVANLEAPITNSIVPTK